jgi:pimeloyl-ACP methyl ester carboxylesterase
MTATRKQVMVADGDVALPGDLTVPDDPSGLVLFAHGSGSSRRSPRNRAVAASLNEAGFCTLLFDLLTADEEGVDAGTGDLRFDIPLLARRLTMAVDWLDGSGERAGQLPYGLFGASTGAAAALVTAGARPGRVRAVVSRGGRPDLAGPLLADLRAPVLLIVGGADAHVLALNEAILGDLPHGSDLAVVPGAGHLFAEPGAIDQVAALAAGWFTRHVGG